MSKEQRGVNSSELHSEEVFDLEALARSIEKIHDELSNQAAKAVNISLTVRNWLIGHYIAEFELRGADRASYGENLLDRLADRLSDFGVKTCDKRRLCQYLRFFNAYPEIVRSLTAQSQALLLSETTQLPQEKVRSAPALSKTRMIESLSYTHIELIVALDTGDKRDGDTYYFVDLVFYHRILKCHVLVDLKLEPFSHENVGQLNTYVSWYDKNVRAKDDNPPIGILLCTERDHSLVEYALAGMDNSLFVSKYQLQLPDRESLQIHLETERRRLEAEQEAPQEKDLQ